MDIVDIPQAKPKGALFYPGRRLYLDASGNAVEAKDPRRVSLLCGEEGGIPMSQAKELGLIPEAKTPVIEEKAVLNAEDKAVAPAENKAIQSPPKTKARPKAK